ncbi:MAG: hypothetical protein ACI8TQ_003688 [Planctomycetota bacterium]|jgi:hypothetical protein
MRTKSIQRLLLVVLGCLLAPSAFAQSFRSFGYDELDGALNSVVLDVDFAPDGRVWLATRIGVTEFDGVPVDAKSKSEGCPLAFVPFHIEFNQAGALWVTTPWLQFGLAKFENQTWTTVMPSVANEHLSRITEFEFAPFEDRECLHALLSKGTLLRLLDDEWTVIASGVHSLQSLPNGLLLATDRGIEELDAAGNFRIVPNSPTDSILSVHRELNRTGPTRTWVLDTEGLGMFTQARYERVLKDSTLFDLRLEERISMQFDGFDGLYLGNSQASYLWSDGKLRSLKDSASSSPEGTRNIVRDNHHNIWLATDYGVHRIPPRAIESYGQEDGLYVDEVSTLLALPGGRMVAGHDAGLTFIDSFSPERMTAQRLKPEADYVGRVLDLEPDGDGGFWIAAGRFGTAHVDRERQIEWHKRPNFEGNTSSDSESWSVSSFAHDTDGKLWRGGYKNLSYNTDSGFVDQPLPFPMSYIRRVVGGSNAELFLCTSMKGVLHLKNGNWSSITATDQRYDNVYCLTIPENAPPLVGTGAGLRVLRDNQLHSPPSHLNLEAAVYTITEDSRGWLWFGTDRGIYRWNGERMRRFTSSDGLAGQEVNRDAVLEDECGLE